MATLAPKRVAVAYSAGRDSTALLHATVHVALGTGVEVLALHVHHGLSPQADAWLAHGQQQCARWARRGLPVRFISHRLSDAPRGGDSIEAWARQARYGALRTMALAEQAGLVLLAHHRRDQAETLLLQALRGGGVAGLAGMPRRVERDGVVWERPWLDTPREAIEAYVRKHRLRFIDDDSNDDERFARNRLRLAVWPALAEAFPQAEGSLAQSARWAQQAAAALDELAAIDLERVADASGLVVSEWRTLSEARQSNALRTWLATIGQPAPASLVLRLQHELGGQGAWPAVGGELRVHRGRLGFVASQALLAQGLEALDRESTLSVLRAGRHALPGWGGELVVTRVKRDGVPLAWLGALALRAREGGEQFQAGVGRPPRSLKKQYQAAAVPAWERDGPLVYSGGQLVFVPGLGLDARVIGLPGQAQVALAWRRTALPEA
ncbi:tRNA lysidine(34) synthetase TilS [Rhizobacter sp. OV335]|uniref:tRNA lysidine(34) synthetase TilS n=1 Tax=Rhizobacter sp. OV335 TaxID=1500264 RepID=UPI0009238B52|nr:tRNA lysidine(34) synthetase TilS [Rhizobacter sp. OV335]SHN14485.1 tRNA(Ile)-lysidine synthase [Rhizobacter sp. OV335]